MCANWWQVQESVRQRVRSGTPTPMARRQGAATTAREEIGVPEGWSSAEGAAVAIALPGASTVAVGVWGAWFSCESRKADDEVLEDTIGLERSGHRNKRAKGSLFNTLSDSHLLSLCCGLTLNFEDKPNNKFLHYL